MTKIIHKILLLIKNHLNYLNHLMIFSNAFVSSIVDFYFVKKYVFLIIYNDGKSKTLTKKKKN